jgi:hypothetical protein
MLKERIMWTPWRVLPRRPTFTLTGVSAITCEAGC